MPLPGSGFGGPTHRDASDVIEPRLRMEMSRVRRRRPETRACQTAERHGGTNARQQLESVRRSLVGRERPRDAQERSSRWVRDGGGGRLRAMLLPAG